MRAVSEFVLTFLCVFGAVCATTTMVTAPVAIPVATTVTTIVGDPEESSTVSWTVPSTLAAPVTATEKVEESSRITTFVPSLTANHATNNNAKKIVRYDGDQVLRVFTVNSKHRKKIKEIERDSSKFVLFFLFLFRYTEIRAPVANIDCSIGSVINL